MSGLPWVAYHTAIIDGLPWTDTLNRLLTSDAEWFDVVVTEVANVGITGGVVS